MIFGAPCVFVAFGDGRGENNQWIERGRRGEDKTLVHEMLAR